MKLFQQVRQQYFSSLIFLCTPILLYAVHCIEITTPPSEESDRSSEAAKIDTTPPFVSNTDPEDGEIDVPITQKVRIIFSEKIDITTIGYKSCVLLDMSGDDENGTPVTSEIDYDNDNATGSIIPNKYLYYKTNYKVTVTTGIKDPRRNALAEDYSFSFTTGEETQEKDTTKPQVKETSPSTDTKSVSLSSLISVTFSEAMDSKTITGDTFTVSAGTTKIQGSVSYSTTTNSATFSPTSPLPAGSTIKVIVSKVITDTAGNALAEDYSFSFTTAAAVTTTAVAAATTTTTVTTQTTTAVTQTATTTTQTTAPVTQPPPTPVNTAAPVLASIGSQTVTKLGTMNFTISATDADGDTLTYSATSLPTGATFNTTTKTFSWTPGCGQNGTHNNINFTVTDNGSPTKSDSETITITVNDTKAAIATPVPITSTSPSNSPAGSVSLTIDTTNTLLAGSSTSLRWKVDSALSGNQYDNTITGTASSVLSNASKTATLNAFHVAPAIDSVALTITDSCSVSSTAYSYIKVNYANPDPSDPNPPAVAVIVPEPSSKDKQGSTRTVTYVCLDDVAGCLSIEWSVTGTGINTTGGVNVPPVQGNQPKFYQGTFNYTVPANTPLNSTITITAYALDAFGNFGGPGSATTTVVSQ